MDTSIDRMIRRIGKKGVTSLQVLAIFDPDKQTLLNTDWSEEGMGWIIMQTADDEESHQ